MTKCFFVKTLSGALAAADSETLAYVQRVKIGAGVVADVKRARNIKFHRKLFALFNLAFDAWDAPYLEYKGQQAPKDFDRFRKDVTILAGYYHTCVTLKGEVRLEPDSLAVHNMDEDTFEKVYKAVLNVVWDRILKSKGYDNKEAVDALVADLMRFE